jgi:hypothetical protein
MFRVATNFGGSADIEAEIAAVLNWKADLGPVRQEVTRIVQEANREDRLEGSGWRGDYLLALAPSTLERRRGSPIPFVEHGEASRVITNLVVVVDVKPARLSIGLRWIGMPWLRFHIEGGPVIPQRDFFGIGPWTLPLVDAAVLRESDRQFPGQDRTAGGGNSVGVVH